MYHAQNTSNLEKMLELAQFAASGHSERRQLEFRIFISYITLLALFSYQVVRPEDSILKEQDGLRLFILLTLFLFLIHYLYCSWQKNISIAAINDVRRRDFHLQKAECLSYHLSQNPNLRFQPSLTKKVSLNMGSARSCEISEWTLFKKTGPDVIEPPLWFELYKNLDAHILFQIGVPTLLLSGLIIAVFKGYIWFQIGAPALLLFGGFAAVVVSRFLMKRRGKRRKAADL